MIVNGYLRNTAALPSRSSRRALDGVQGMSGFLRVSKTNTRFIGFHHS